MKHYKEDVLLSYYYEELDTVLMVEIAAHLNDCKVCRQYIRTLELTEERFRQLGTSLPVQNTFDLIMDSVEIESGERAKIMDKVSVIPYLILGASVLAIFGIVHFFHQNIAAFSLFEPLARFDFWRLLGSIPKTIALFIVIGGFLSLAMAPVLVMDLEKNNKIKAD